MKKTIFLALFVGTAILATAPINSLYAHKTPGEKVDETIDKAKDTYKDTKENVKEKYKDTKENAKEKYNETLEKGKIKNN